MFVLTVSLDKAVMFVAVVGVAAAVLYAIYKASCPTEESDRTDFSKSVPPPKSKR